MVGLSIKITGDIQVTKYLQTKMADGKGLCSKINVGIGDRVNTYLLQNLPEWDRDLKNSITRTEVTFVNTCRLWFRFPVRHVGWAENGRPSAKAKFIASKPNHTMRYWTGPHQTGQVIFRKRVGPAPQQPYKVQHAHAIQRTTTWGNSISHAEGAKVVSQWLQR